VELDNDQYQPTGFEQVTCTPNGGTPRDLVVGGVADAATEKDIVLTNNRIALESIVTADLINPANTIECSGTISVQYIGDAEGNGGGDGNESTDCVDVEVTATIQSSQERVEDIEYAFRTVVQAQYVLKVEAQCSRNNPSGPSPWSDDCVATARFLPTLDTTAVTEYLQAVAPDDFAEMLRMTTYGLTTYVSVDSISTSSTDATCPSEGGVGGGRKLEANGSKKQQRGSKTIQFHTETRGLQDLAEEGVFSLDITVVSGAAVTACSRLFWSLVSIGVFAVFF